MNQNSTIFRTINGDLTLFDSKITQLPKKINTLNTAFERYNSISKKSSSFQSTYNKAPQNSDSSLAKYLSGLNGAKASMSGYIKSLVAAKAASIGLQVASIALNTAITMGVSLAISTLVSQISKWIHAQEEARQKSVELTIPCLNNKCNMKVVEHYYCDNCGDEFDSDDIYIFNGKDLCRWCLLSQFKTISEIG